MTHIHSRDMGARSASSRQQELAALLRGGRIARKADLVAQGYYVALLREAVACGLVVRVAPGLYATPGETSDLSTALRVLSMRRPAAVIAGRAAAWLHGLLPEPEIIEFAAERSGKYRRPAGPTPDGRPIRQRVVADGRLNWGVGEVGIDGLLVRVTCPARTIADFLVAPMRDAEAFAEAIDAFRRRGGDVAEVKGAAQALGMPEAVRWDAFRVAA